jgi:hypothetical protein
VKSFGSKRCSTGSSLVGLIGLENQDAYTRIANILTSYDWRTRTRTASSAYGGVARIQTTGIKAQGFDPSQVLIDLRRVSSLACSINMMGAARGGLTSYTSPRETLADTFSRPNSEALAAYVVLAHPRVAFHPCTCGLSRGVAALIGYDDIKVVVDTTTRMRLPPLH